MIQQQRNVVDQHKSSQTIAYLVAPTMPGLKRSHEDIEIPDDADDGVDDHPEPSFVEAFDATQEFLRKKPDLRSFNDDVYWNMCHCGLWQQRISFIHSLFRASSREAMMCALFQCTRGDAEDLSHSFCCKIEVLLVELLVLFDKLETHYNFAQEKKKGGRPCLQDKKKRVLTVKLDEIIDFFQQVPMAYCSKNLAIAFRSILFDGQLHLHLKHRCDAHRLLHNVDCRKLMIKFAEVMMEVNPNWFSANELALFVQEAFGQHISQRTANTWLHDLDYKFGIRCKHQKYIDGHERSDVVAYRDEFLKSVERFMKRKTTFEGEERNIEALPTLETGTRPLDFSFHDETCCKTKGMKSTTWKAANGTARVMGKSSSSSDEGEILMVSGFVNEKFGMDAKTLFFLDVSKDGYFNGKMFLEQIRVRLNNVLLPRYSTHHGHVDCFDNSSGHGFFADDALLVSKLNKLPGWCREEPALIRDGWFLQRLKGSQNDHVASQDEANTFRNRKGDFPPAGWKLQAQHMFFRVGDIVHVHIPANKSMQMIDKEEDNNNFNSQPSQQKSKAKKRSNTDIDRIMGKFISSQAGEADIDASQPTPPPPPLSRKKATLKTTKAYSPGDILAVDDIAVIGALKGVEQILLERGVRFEQKACSSKKLIVQYKTQYKQAIEDFREDKYNVGKLENVINQKTPDEVEILANNLNCRCPHCVLRKEPDFAFKQNAMEELYSMFNNTHGTDFQCIFLPKFHPELNPIERVWSAMKCHVHKRLDFKGPSMRELENLMRQGLSSEYLPISRIRKYFGTSWNYMEEYRQGSTLLQADEHIKQRRSHRSYSTEMDSKIDQRPGSANSPSSRPTMNGQPTPTNCVPSLLQSLASATSSHGTSSSSGHHVARRSGSGSGSTDELSASIRKTLAGEEATVRSALTATAADKVEAIADDVELKSTQHDGDDDDVNDDVDIDLMMQRWERGVALLDIDCEDD